ncbi:MAG: hypothetical protein ACJ798_12235 [Phenylobacterium sp.]
MTSRDRRITEEVTALWHEIFGGPPPPQADGDAMLKIITGSLPEVGYDRMRSPYLRPSLVVRPKG